MDTGEPKSEATQEEVIKQETNKTSLGKTEYSGGHRKADVVTDESFPSLPSRLPVNKPEDLAYIVSYVENIPVMKHTATTGRAGFYPITFEAGGQNYNCLFVKGTGMPEIYVQSSGLRTAFSVHHREENKDMFRIIGYKPDVIGLCTRNDQVLDAERSIWLHKLGVKVRIPLKGFFLESLETEKGEESTRSLQGRGLINESERPVLVPNLRTKLC